MSAIDALLKGKTTKTAIPKSKKSTSAIDALLSGKKTTETIPQNVRTVGFPEHLGGGQYKVSDIPGELVLSPRSQSALSSKGTIERDHIIPVALAGTSADENLQYKPTTEAGRQAGKMAIEQDAIAKYQKGEININEARLLVQTKQQELLGLTPTKEEQTAEGQLKKRFGALGNVIGKVGGAIEGVVDTIKKPFEKKDGMRFEVAEGLSGVDKAQAQNVINYEIAKGQEEKAKLPLPTKIKQAVAGQARKGMPDYQAYTAKEKEPIIEERKKAIEAEREYEKTLTPLQRAQKTDPYLIRKAKIASEVLGREVKPENVETENISKAEKDLIEAIGVERTTEKVARVATAPVRFLAGYPAAAIVSYALEKADSDLSLDPNKMPEGKDKDLMKLLTGDTEVKRLMESEDLYGIIGRAAGMPVALAVMAILENPFIAGTGLKTIIKDAIKKEGAEMVSKIGPKEYLKQVIKYTDDAIKKEFMAGNISKDVAEQALKEVGLPAKLAKDLEPERVLAEGSEKAKKTEIKPNKNGGLKNENAPGEDLEQKLVVDTTKKKESVVEPLEQEAKKYKTAEEFIKAQSLYHGTPAKLEGNKLSFGKGDIKKGGQSGGLFLTDNQNIAKTFAFGGDVYQATPEIKKQVIDLTKKEGIDKFRDFIGKSYKDFDGELIKFDKQSFDSMFPNGKADFATVAQFPELVELVVKNNKLKGIAFNEYAGGEIGKTYQILSGDIPVYTKSQLTDIWNKANKIEPINSVNPTGKIFTEYTPNQRAIAELGENITTLDKTANKKPDELITIYRGAPKNQKEIVAGDFITTNKQLAKDYAGDGIVLEKRVKAKDILDDITEPLGEEYIYKPTTNVWNKAKGETKKSALPKPKKQPIKYIPEGKVNARKKITIEKTLFEQTTPKKIQKETIEKGLIDDFKNIPEYEKINLKDQAARVAKLINEDPEKAVRIALGKELPEGDLLPESVLIGVKNQALKDGNTDLLIKLATEETGVAKGTTLLGQRIKALDEGLEDDAFRNIRRVVENRKKNLTAKAEKTAKEVRSKARKTIQEAKPNKYDWQNLIAEIAC